MRPRASSKKHVFAPKKDHSRSKRTSRTGGSKAVAPFPVVGIGASAGGLEAVTQLLSCLPPDTGMAFVLIQHLDPQHESQLTKALSRATEMTVAQIVDGMRVKPNHFYVIPPNADVGILHGVLTLLPRSTDPHRQHLPIDFFFRALAADLGSQSIGVVLSGTASDGTGGLRAIKGENGIALAQDPASAKFPGMPQSAIDAGVVDGTLTPPRLAEELARLARHPYFVGNPSQLVAKTDDETLQKIFVVVRDAVGVDYSEYKPTTVSRRLGRRMAVRRVSTKGEYLDLLLEDPAEAKLLYEDVLIHVTSFFRDAAVFEQIKKDVFPKIFAAKKDDSAPIRLWVAGCSTGEEVYTLAIALIEFLDDNSCARPIQIFGTDISEKAIDAARAGVYPAGSLQELSEERRRRFFTRVDRGYRISKSVRELCVFVRHDLARDPPFSKLDLVSCRNVLIYFGAALQKRIIATFHYCLNFPGFLVLGRTESISGFSHFFTKSERGGKTFARTARRSSLIFGPRAKIVAVDSHRGTLSVADPPRASVDLVKYVDRLLLKKYAPAGVVVNERLEILQFRGRTGAFLEPAAGAPQLNLLKMAREGLLSPLRMALAQAKKTKTVARQKDVLIGAADSGATCDIVVAPISASPEIQEPLYLVLFENESEAGPERRPQPSKAKKGKRRVARAAGDLERELAATRDYLESLLEDHARTNDDLASANEEFVSNNEELQSMNEELETAKEELQSTNEELTTVNDELHSRNQEVSQSNGDLLNLLNTVDIPVVMLDVERRIKRFTPRARAVLNVQPSDVGRRIDEIKPNIGAIDLEEQVAAVIDSGSPRELEVQDRHGHWYRMQILPSLSSDSKIDGAILSLIDIDALKHHVSDAEWARDYAVGIVEAVQVPLIVLDQELRVVSANRAFYETFRTTPEASETRRLYDLDDGIWDIAALRAPLQQMLANDSWLGDLELEHDFGRIGRRVIRASACAVHSHTNVPMILLALEDITTRKRSELERADLLTRTQAAKENAERANSAKDQFLAVLSHELRTPLATLLLQSHLLRRDAAVDLTKINRIGDTIERNTVLQIQLIDDLLDVSRIVAGKLKLEPEEIDFSAVVHAAVENVSAVAQLKSVPIVVDIEPQLANISGDPVRLLQVVSNLLTNAVKFSHKGGRVTVGLTRVDGHASLRVSDQGRGIEAAFLPHIFDRFSQQDSSTTRTSGGLGLGLAIVRHIVDLHGGTVRAESAGPGHGASFFVTLPLLPGRQSSATASAISAREARLLAESSNDLEAELRGIRVLVVDDDVAIRETASEILGMLGATVVSAASSAEALMEIDKARFDVILCDIAMPKEDGYDFIRQLRRLDPERGGATPAIAFTALAGDENRLRSMAAGFQLHLSKPIDVKRLAASVLEVAEHAQAPN